MKILIVDDENSKSNRIKNVIISVGIDNRSIDCVASINEASLRMRELRYQLAIIDMKIPKHFGEDCRDDGGIQLLEEIRSNANIQAPNEIVMLSMYQELLDRYNQNSDVYNLENVLFDESSTEWEQKIRNKIEWLMRVDNSPLEKKDFNYDVAIITAVEIETRAVKELEGSNWKHLRVIDDSARYYEDTWKNPKGKELHIVRAQLPEMGMVSAATLTMKIIHNFRPRYIVMPGIAGGIDKEHHIGDILIPSEVKDYSSGKYSSPSDAEIEDAKKNPLKYFLPTSSSINTDRDIVNYAMGDFGAVLSKIHNRWEEKLQSFTGTTQKVPYYIPSIRHNTLASGAAVVQNDAVIDIMIKPHARKTEGIDMEAYGMYFAALNASNPKPTPLVMKAFSDFSDVNKNDTNQPYAAFVSAEFMKYFITEIVLTDN